MKTPEELEQKIETLLIDLYEFIGGGNYIFRGENKNNGEISSSLYRYFKTVAGRAELQKTATAFDFNSIEQELKIQLGEFAQSIDFAITEKILKENILDQLAQKKNYFFNIERIQEELILTDVQEYVDFDDKKYILTELQHYGGATNLIDFSHDIAVALFFACDGEPEKDGRLILLKADADGVEPPRKNQNNRAVFQNSIFVRRDKGYIDEDEKGVEKIIIPYDIKEKLLTYVQDYFGIRTETVYGDLIGYIQNQERHGDAYQQFFAGLIYYDNGEPEKAIECYTKAIKVKPNYAAAYNNRGSAKMNMIPRDLKGAFADYKDAIARNPNNAGAYNNRSAAYNERGDKGDYDLAITDSSKAIELNPNYAAAYNNRGGAHGNKGENDLAIADFSKAIELNPNYALAYDNRAHAYCNKDDFELAIADFSKFIHIEPKNATAYKNRGMAHFHDGGFNRAVIDFSKAIGLNPNDATAYNKRGEVYGSMGYDDRAVADFNKAIKLNSKCARAYYNLGISKRLSKDYKEAKEYFETALPLAKQQKNESLVTLIQEEIDNLLADSD